MRYLYDETARLLASRRASGGQTQAIIDRLLAAKDPESGRSMTDAELIANLYGFLVAGHETSAVALGWSLWLLAKDQASQERVRDEVRAIAGDADIRRRHDREAAIYKAGDTGIDAPLSAGRRDRTTAARRHDARPA